MKITKNGFYITSNLNVSYISIEDNLDDIIIFDNNNQLKKIEIGNNSRLNYFSYFNSPKNYNKHILLTGENSNCTLHTFIFSKDNSIKLEILGEVNNNNSKIDMSILSFIGKGGFIDLDGIVKINKNLKKVEGYLKEENIFLGNKGKIKGIPTLLVASEDTKASHSCKIERVSDKDLFYLRSRGIKKDNAINMMLKNAIASIFTGLGQKNQKFCSNLVKEIFEEI